jgi:hypothetical protein
VFPPHAVTTRSSSSERNRIVPRLVGQNAIGDFCSPKSAGPGDQQGPNQRKVKHVQPGGRGGSITDAIILKPTDPQPFRCP